MTSTTGRKPRNELLAALKNKQWPVVKKLIAQESPMSIYSMQLENRPLASCCARFSPMPADTWALFTPHVDINVRDPSFQWVHTA